jgi:hypothetical protein
MEPNDCLAVIDNYSIGLPDRPSILKKLVECIYSTKSNKDTKHTIKKSQKKRLALVIQALNSNLTDKEIFETPIYSFADVNVNLKFTTATPLQLSLKSHQLPMKSVNHIICNVADMQLYSELFMAMHVCEELKGFRTLTLLLPADFEKNPQRFCLVFQYDK